MKNNGCLPINYKEEKMSREREIILISRLLDKKRGSCPANLATWLVDNGIGSKDRFEAYLDDMDRLQIEPINYKEEK